MSSYQEQSTNFMTNPFNPNFLKQKFIEEPQSLQDDQNSKTITFANLSQTANDETTKTSKMPKKIKAPLPGLNSCQQSQNLENPNRQINCKSLNKIAEEQELTTKTQRRGVNKNKKVVHEEEKKKPESLIKLFREDEKSAHVKVDLTSNACHNKGNESAQISASILTKPSLRQKFSHLLPKIHQKAISSDQQHLLTILSMMDETIEFSTRNRAVKFMFFMDLKRIIRDSLKVLIDYKHLEQLLYLDPTLFIIRWQKNVDNTGYDIIMNQSEIKSKQIRKSKVREVIVEYLTLKHEQFLARKGVLEYPIDGPWHEEFVPGKYEIPRKTLPPHPQTQSAQLRCLDDRKIEAIKNPKVKQLFKSEKSKSEVQSFNQQSAMDMIFAGTGAKALQQRLMFAVKERQEQAKLKMAREAKQVEKQKTSIESNVLKEIAEVILKTYMSKNVTNIFKVKVIEIVRERTNNKFGDFVLHRHMQYLIQQKSLGYLKEVTTRDKTIILQINSSRYKDVLAHAESLKQTKKDQPQIEI